MNRRDHERRRWGSRALLPAGAAALLALVVRVIYLVQASDNPFWRALGLDMAGYDRWARAVLEGHGLGEAPFTQAPFFPLALSLAYRVLGPDPVRALWFHLLPGTAAVFLAADAAGKWKGPVAGWTAGLLLALYKPAIFYTGVLLPPAWVLFLASLCLWLTARGGTPGGTGAAFGLLALAQPTALTAAIPAAWWLNRSAAPGATSSRSAGREARRGRRLLWFAAGAVAPLVLTLLYNGAAGHAWSFVAVNGGINLYIGNGPEADGAYVRPPGMREDRDLLGVEAARAATPGGFPRSDAAGAAGIAGSGGVPSAWDGSSLAAADRSWRGRALGQMARAPGRALGLFLRKLILFFGQYEVPQVESLPFERRYAWLLRLPLPGMAFLTTIGLLGALLLWRDPRARWLAASAGAIALGVAVFFVTARFRLAAAPFLAVLGGGAAADIAENRALRRLWPPFLGSAAAWILLSLNLTGLNAKASEGQYHFRLGVILEKQGRAAEAMEEYQRAIQLDPSTGKAEVNLGTLLARQGKLAEAREHLERGVALDPQSAVGYVNLGQLHQVEGRAEEALASYAQARRIDPTLLSASESAAYLEYEMGRIEEARNDLEAVTRIAPSGSPPARRVRTLLDLLPERSGLPASESSALLRRADLRLAQGDASGARRIYQQVAATASPGPGEPQVVAAAVRMLQRLQGGSFGAR
jgi:tetratricopeptide (TPR) repeat protein